MCTCCLSFTWSLTKYCNGAYCTHEVYGTFLLATECSLQLERNVTAACQYAEYVKSA